MMTDDEIPDDMNSAALNILKELHQLSVGAGCASGDPWSEMYDVFETIWCIMSSEDVFTTHLFAKTSPAH
jgi:hypothetical protein